MSRGRPLKEPLALSPQRIGARDRSAMAKQQLKGLTVDTNFLLGCSDTDLASYELARLSAAANLRSELLEIFDRLVDTMGQAQLARWFRNTDRQALKSAIESPEEAILRIAALAKKQIRDDQRSGEELIPLPSLPVGVAHVLAAVRYQQRNIAEDKCQNCPQLLDPRSHRYCTKHLRMERERKAPKRQRAIEPGSIAWLYGESLEPGDGRSFPKERQKMRRIAPEGKALLQRIAKEVGSTYEHVRRVALGDIRSDRVMAIINRELDAILEKGPR
jgi:hypothetical protein